MIISASRRTDLPAAHPRWLMERFHEGYVLVRNPINHHQVSRISLHPDDVDGVVFWTKNPAPFMEYLNYFRKYAYYFQFTLTGYETDVEMNLPSHERRLDTFLSLAEKIGPERVLWRYDPILLNRKYTADWHLETFRRYADRLKGATKRATISFVDTYARNRHRMEDLGVQQFSPEMMTDMARELARIARANGMETVACCEDIDLAACGVGKAKCVDSELLSRIGGIPMKMIKDPNQREHCGCAPSVDIGAYNTCPNGCVYCYANYSPALLKQNLAVRDDSSPLLCSVLQDGDIVRERKMPSLREGQLRMEF